jgi:hypothetical protein
MLRAVKKYLYQLHRSDGHGEIGRRRMNARSSLVVVSVFGAGFAAKSADQDRPARLVSDPGLAATMDQAQSAKNCH